MARKYKTKGRKYKNRYSKVKKAGTKSEERRRTIIEKTIEGRKYKYRESVNNIIDKLKKTVGHEYVGPPDFKGTHTWTSKYEELKNIMPKLGKRDNDKTLDVGGWTYNKLKDLKIQHNKKVKEYEAHHSEMMEMLSQMPPAPTITPTKVTKLTGQGKKKKSNKKKKSKTKKKRSKK
jgi:hypothetical protein